MRIIWCSAVCPSTAMIGMLLLWAFTDTSAALSVISLQNPVRVFSGQTAVLPISLQFQNPAWEFYHVKWDFITGNRPVLVYMVDHCTGAPGSWERTCQHSLEQAGFYQQRVNVSFKSASLVLKGVQPEDAGTYRITVRSLDVSGTALVNLTVEGNRGEASPTVLEGIRGEASPLVMGGNRGEMSMTEGNIGEATPLVKEGNIGEATPLVTEGNIGETTPPVTEDNRDEGTPLVMGGNKGETTTLSTDGNREEASPLVRRSDRQEASPLVTGGALPALSIITPKNPVRAITNQTALLPFSFQSLNSAWEFIYIKWEFIRGIGNLPILVYMLDNCTGTAHNWWERTCQLTKEVAKKYQQRADICQNATLVIRGVQAADAGMYLVTVRTLDIWANATVNLMVTEGIKGLGEKLPGKASVPLTLSVWSLPAWFSAFWH
ncbi:uncharacterized protein ACDP82_015776 isoform 2-T4 [Pangshura tecta]